MIKQKNIIQQVNERIYQHGRANKISQLCLDEINIVKFQLQITTAVQKCVNVAHLSMASCGLLSLTNLPKLGNLKYLDLQQNQFTDKNLIQLSNQYQILDGLNLSKNNIQKLQSIIQCVNKLSIKEINIFQTKIFQSSPKVIQNLFQNCKTLRCINWQDRRGKQVKQFQQESQSQSQGESENNQKNYFDNNSIQESISMQSSKKVKVQ